MKELAPDLGRGGSTPVKELATDLGRGGRGE